MRTIITALKAHLLAAGITAYWVDVPDLPTFPYVLFWGPAWGKTEDSLAPTTAIDTILKVTTVAENPDLALTFTSRVLTLLDKKALTAQDRTFELNLEWSQDVEVDRQVTLPPLNRHPAYAVSGFHLNASPEHP